MFWKFWGVKCPPGCAPVPRVTLLVSKPAKWLRLFFVPKQLVMLIIMYQTNTEHPAVTFTMSPMRRINLHSNVEVFMLLTLCSNFQVFAHFALQFSPMKLYFWYLSCKHFPEIAHQHGRPQKFFQGWAKSTFCLSLSSCWQRNAKGRAPQKKSNVTAAVAYSVFPVRKLYTEQMFVLVSWIF